MATFSGSNQSVLIMPVWSRSNRSTEDSSTTTSIQVSHSVPLVSHGVPRCAKNPGKTSWHLWKWYIRKNPFRNSRGFRNDPENIGRQSHQAQNDLKARIWCFCTKLDPVLPTYSYIYPPISGNIASNHFGFLAMSPPCSSPDESQILCENIESDVISQKKSTRGEERIRPPRLRVTII